MRRHLTYANVLATLALFFALAGGSYAAVTLPKSSVGAKQLKKNAVTTRAIKDNAILGRDINELTLGTVPSARTAARATAADTATSATTATSAINATTAASAAVAGSADVAMTASNADKLDGLDAAQLTLRCPAGTRPKWGGCLELEAHAPRTPLEALEDCSSRGGRLPTWLELRWVGNQDDIVWAQGAGFNQYELTGEVYDPSNREMIAVSEGGAFFNATENATNIRHRCVLAQVNG